MVAAGELGDIRVVQVEYPQDWLTEQLEDERPEAGGMAHRSRRSRAPAARSATSAPMPTISPTSSRGLELDRAARRSRRPSCRAGGSTTMSKSCCASNGGARGMLWASQVAPGNENGLKLRVYGTKGGLEWAQDDPNYLWFTPFGEPQAADHPRRRRRPARRPRASPACRPAIRRAISRPSPTSMPRWRGPSARRAPGTSADAEVRFPDRR